MASREDGYQAYDARDPAEDGPGPIGYAALVAAWLAPGLGHWLIGQKARGVILGLTVYILFGAGLLLGGIRAINPADQPIWTYTQFLTGWPMLISNHLEMQTRLELADPATINNPELKEQTLQYQMEYQPRPMDETPDQAQARAKAFLDAHPIFAYHPKVQDMGSVYCGIAGMLNLLVIFDVLLRITGSTREDPEQARRERLKVLRDQEKEAAPADAATGGAS